METDCETVLLSNDAGICNEEISSANVEIETGHVEIETGNVEIETGNVQVDTGNVQIDTGNVHIETGNDRIENATEEIAIEDEVEEAKVVNDVISADDMITGDGNDPDAAAEGVTNVHVHVYACDEANMDEDAADVEARVAAIVGATDEDVDDAVDGDVGASDAVDGDGDAPDAEDGDGDAGNGDVGDANDVEADDTEDASMYDKVDKPSLELCLQRVWQHVEKSSKQTRDGSPSIFPVNTKGRKWQNLQIKIPTDADQVMVIVVKTNKLQVTALAGDGNEETPNDEGDISVCLLEREDQDGDGGILKALHMMKVPKVPKKSSDVTVGRCEFSDDDTDGNHDVSFPDRFSSDDDQAAVESEDEVKKRGGRKLFSKKFSDSEKDDASDDEDYTPYPKSKPKSKDSNTTSTSGSQNESTRTEKRRGRKKKPPKKLFSTFSYTCVSCDNEFERSELSRAGLCHECVRKPYRCKMCTSSFSELEDLKKHYKKHFDEVSPEEKSNKRSSSSVKKTPPVSTSTRKLRSASAKEERKVNVKEPKKSKVKVDEVDPPVKRRRGRPPKTDAEKENRNKSKNADSAENRSKSKNSEPIENRSKSKNAEPAEKESPKTPAADPKKKVVFVSEPGDTRGPPGKKGSNPGQENYRMYMYTCSNCQKLCCSWMAPLTNVCPPCRKLPQDHKCKSCERLFLNETTLSEHVCDKQNEDSPTPTRGRKRSLENKLIGESPTKKRILAAYTSEQKSGRSNSERKCKVVGALKTAAIAEKEREENNVMYIYQFRCVVCGRTCRNKTFPAGGRCSDCTQEQNNAGQSFQYLCKVCSKSFQDTQAFLMHYRSHFQQVTFSCTTCEAKFLSEAKLEEHIAKGHTDIPCKKCHEQFPSKPALEAHHKEVHPECRKGCSVCPETFPTYYALKKHMLAEHPEAVQPAGRRGPRRDAVEGEVYPCDICDRKFRSAAKLKNHELLHKDDDELQDLTCSTCNEKFTSLLQLKKHRRLHRNFRCDKCQVSFESQDKLEDHAQMHSENGVFQCTECELTFDKYQKLKYHKAVHKSKEFVCHICGKAYRRKIILDEHLETHKETRPFSCPICKFGFFSERRLKVHMGNHAEKQFECNLCSRKYSIKSRLTRHLAAHARGKARSTLFNFTCILCHEEFDSPTRLRTHYDEMHPLSTHLCMDCGTQVGPFTELKDHFRFAHGNPDINLCQVCGRAFSQKERYNNHRRLHLENTGLMNRRVRCCFVCGLQFESADQLTTHLDETPSCKSELEQHDAVIESTGGGPKLTPAGRKAQPTSKSESCTCPDCGEEFHSRMRYHHHRWFYKKCYKCSVCLKVFQTDTGILMHLQKAHLVNAGDPNPFKCSECDRSFSNQSNLTNHLRTHQIKDKSNVVTKRFACDQCKKVFSTNAHLIIHRQQHDGVGLVCPECGKNFTNDVSLQYHMRRHTGEGPSCPICGKVFVNRKYQKAHIESHTGKLNCNMCNAKFQNRNVLTLHHIREHSGAGLCKRCGMGFVTPESREAHKHECPGPSQHCQKKEFAKNATSRFRRGKYLPPAEPTLTMVRSRSQGMRMEQATMRIEQTELIVEKEMLPPPPPQPSAQDLLNRLTSSNPEIVTAVEGILPGPSHLTQNIMQSTTMDGSHIVLGEEAGSQLVHQLLSSGFRIVNESAEVATVQQINTLSHDRNNCAVMPTHHQVQHQVHHPGAHASAHENQEELVSPIQHILLAGAGNSGSSYNQGVYCLWTGH